MGALARGLVGTGTVAIVAYEPLLLLAAGAVLVLIVGGVMLPVVWSRKKNRREAAQAVLRLLLPVRSPPLNG